MPAMKDNYTFAANEFVPNLLDGLDYEFLAGPAFVQLLASATTAGVQLTLKINTDSVVDRALANVNDPVLVVRANEDKVGVSRQRVGAGRLRLVAQEILGGTPTLQWMVDVDPVPSGLI